MEREFWPEALEDWSKGCAGCVAREELNIAFVALDKACVSYGMVLSATCRLWALDDNLNIEGALISYSAQFVFFEFMDWHRRLVERHRLSDLAVVLLYYLAEQYGELDEHLRDGVAASDEYIKYAIEGSFQRSKAFEQLKQEHEALCAALDELRGISRTQLQKQALLREFSKLEAAYNDVVAKTTTVWENLLPYKEERAKQAFRVSVSGR